VEALTVLRAFVPAGPYALVICGLPAAGKSTLAARASAVLAVPVLSSDVVRKALAGVGPGGRAGEQFYTGEFSHLVHAELGARAAALVAAGGAVIVDATFRRRADRDAFRQAFGPSGPLLYAEIRVPVLLARAARRDRDGSAVSDADTAVVQREASRWQPLAEIPAARHLVLAG
jgi:uncharacterized protein